MIAMRFIEERRRGEKDAAESEWYKATDLLPKAPCETLMALLGTIKVC